jgi:hypothetical protein
MALNKKQKTVVRIVGLLAVAALILTSLAPALTVMLSQQ